MTVHVQPPAPGDLIRRQVLTKFALRQSDLAAAMGVSKVRLNLIINRKAPLTPEMALRLAAVTDTAVEYWLATQVDYELFRAEQRLGGELSQLTVLAECTELSATL